MEKQVARREHELQELERHRLAAELHDRVGQALSAISINLDIALGQLPPDQADLKLRLADSLALVEGALHSIEGMMAELRPPLLDEYGLGAALGLYAKRFSQRSGVPVVLEDPHDLGRLLRPEAAIVLFRIAQEALANVAKHAEAKRARLSLAASERSFLLEIADDGRGFDPRERLAQSRRWGVRTMRERAAAIGARLEVQSAPGGGTSVRVRVARP